MGGTIIRLFLRKDVELEKLPQEVSRWLVFLEFPVEVVVDNETPQQIWGIKGNLPQEISNDIMKSVAEPGEEYCPIIFNRDGVEVVVLWEANRLGNNYLLAPAGRHLLPLDVSLFRYWNSGDFPRRHKREEPRTLRKIANGGIYLADDLPGFKVAERTRFHYVVDCRRERRFTPLVSRSGIAIDGNAISILQILVEGLVEFVVSNVESLLKTGISKYFTAYYAASAMSLLFDRSRLKETDEVVLSAVFAAQQARKVPMLLIVEQSEIALKTWKDHEGRPVVIGRNIYDNLLKSVVIGIAEFPLPHEVLQSLPDNYLVPAGAEDVIHPILLLAQYEPTQVRYVPSTKGVFIVCNPKPKDSAITFSGIPVLEFPAELVHVSLIRFDLAKCWNKSNDAVQQWFSLASTIITGVGEPQRKKVEENIEHLLRGSEKELMFDIGPETNHQAISDKLSRQFTSQFQVDIEIPIDAIKVLLSARVISDDLWHWDNF